MSGVIWEMLLSWYHDKKGVLADIDSAISNLRMRINLREWIKRKKLLYILAANVLVDQRSLECFQIENVADIKLVKLYELITLLKLLSVTCGESLIVFHQRFEYTLVSQHFTHILNIDKFHFMTSVKGHRQPPLLTR